jgi:hypothetical protein
VSIGLSVYNGELPRVLAINSILAQDFRDLEIIYENAATRPGSIRAAIGSTLAPGSSSPVQKARAEAARLTSSSATAISRRRAPGKHA